MAEDSAQERTEEATQHRREEAIKSGDLVHSREVVTAAVVLAAALALPLMQPLFTRVLSGVMVEFLRFDQLPIDDLSSFQAVMLRMVVAMLPILVPVFLLVIAVGLTANVIQVGWRFSSERLAPNADRLDAMRGLERIVGRPAVAETVRTIVKFLIVGFVTALTIRGQMDEILGLHGIGPAQVIPVFAGMLWQIAWQIGLLLVGFSILDYGYQRWEWNRRLRMSHQELKEELKDREGDPLIKQRMRSLQMEHARQRMARGSQASSAAVTELSPPRRGERL